jgi:hypothetical protein
MVGCAEIDFGMKIGGFVEFLSRRGESDRGRCQGLDDNEKDFLFMIVCVVRWVVWIIHGSEAEATFR